MHGGNPNLGRGGGGGDTHHCNISVIDLEKSGIYRGHAAQTIKGLLREAEVPYQAMFVKM